VGGCVLEIRTDDGEIAELGLPTVSASRVRNSFG
jgi:hypothetical protein